MACAEEKCPAAVFAWVRLLSVVTKISKYAAFSPTYFIFWGKMVFLNNLLKRLICIRSCHFCYLRKFLPLCQSSLPYQRSCCDWVNQIWQGWSHFEWERGQAYLLGQRKWARRLAPTWGSSRNTRIIIISEMPMPAFNRQNPRTCPSLTGVCPQNIAQPPLLGAVCSFWIHIK